MGWVDQAMGLEKGGGSSFMHHVESSLVAACIAHVGLCHQGGSVEGGLSLLGGVRSGTMRFDSVAV